MAQKKQKIPKRAAGRDGKYKAQLTRVRRNAISALEKHLRNHPEDTQAQARLSKIRAIEPGTKIRIRNRNPKPNIPQYIRPPRVRAQSKKIAPTIFFGKISVSPEESDV